jgi:hypothetical protein
MGGFCMTRQNDNSFSVFVLEVPTLHAGNVIRFAELRPSGEVFRGSSEAFDILILRTYFKATPNEKRFVLSLIDVAAS